MMAQMATMAMTPPTAPHTWVFLPRETFHVPPIQKVAVPMHQPFTAQWGFSTGRGGLRGCRSRIPFADVMRGTRAVAPLMTNMVPYGRSIVQIQAAPGGRSQCRNTDFLNIYKQHNNWMCASVAGLIWKTGTHLSHAHSKSGITKIHTHATMHSNSSQQVTICTRRECTSRSYHPVEGTPDSVGQRV